MADAPLAERALIDQRRLRGAASRVTGLPARSTSKVIVEAGVEERRLLQVLEARDRPAVDGLDDIAGLEAGVGGRRIRLDETDARQVFGAPEARNSPVNSTTARMKLAAGPAATIAARLRSGWPASERARS